MGSLFRLCAWKTRSTRLSSSIGSRNRRIMRIVKVDGDVIEFTTPMVVKELLMNYEGFEVKSSVKSSKNLPTSFKLKLGKVYYLMRSMPCSSPSIPDQISPKEPEAVSVKRIKVVITKKQLQELLSKRALSINRIDDAIKNWKPRLSSIPEEPEMISTGDM